MQLTNLAAHIYPVEDALDRWIWLPHGIAEHAISIFRTMTMFSDTPINRLMNIALYCELTYEVD